MMIYEKPPRQNGPIVTQAADLLSYLNRLTNQMQIAEEQRDREIKEMKDSALVAQQLGDGTVRIS